MSGSGPDLERGSLWELQRAGPVSALAIAPDGSWLATGGGSSLVQIWDIATGRLRNFLAGHSEPVNTVPSAQTAGSSRLGATITLCRSGIVVTGAAIGGPFTGHTSVVTRVVFSPDGGLLASASTDGNHTLLGHRHRVGRR